MIGELRKLPIRTAMIGFRLKIFILSPEHALSSPRECQERELEKGGSEAVTDMMEGPSRSSGYERASNNLKLLYPKGYGSERIRKRPSKNGHVRSM